MLHDQGCHLFVAIVISFKFVFVLFLLKFGNKLRWFLRSGGYVYCLSQMGNKINDL